MRDAEEEEQMPPLKPKPYTEPANHLLTLAGQISAGLRAGYTGTEHLLMALLLFEQSGAFAVLRHASISAEDVNTRLRNLMVVHEGSDNRVPSTKPTDAVNAVLSTALEEAEELGFPYVASEQLLVALIQQSDTVASRVLHQLGLDVERARSIVSQLHAQSEAEPATVEA